MCIRDRDFIAAFTHEVKTPMTAMLGYADLMRARPDDTETQREAAGYICLLYTSFHAAAGQLFK